MNVFARGALLGAALLGFAAACQSNPPHPGTLEPTHHVAPMANPKPKPVLRLEPGASTTLRGTYESHGRLIGFSAEAHKDGKAFARFTDESKNVLVEAALEPGDRRYVRIGGHGIRVGSPTEPLSATDQALLESLGSRPTKLMVGLVPLELSCAVPATDVNIMMRDVLALPFALLYRMDSARYAPELLDRYAGCQPKTNAGSGNGHVLDDTGGCDSVARPIQNTQNGSCCDDHDICYHVNGCTAASWLWTALGIYTACTMCNTIVAGCILTNSGTGKSSCINNGTCGWNWCGGTNNTLNAKYFCPPDDTACNCMGPCMDDGTGCAGATCGEAQSKNCPGRTVSCGTCSGSQSCNFGQDWQWHCVDNSDACVDDGTACSGKECNTFPSNNCTHVVSANGSSATVPVFVTCGTCDPQFSCQPDGKCGKPSVLSCVDDNVACNNALQSNPGFCGWVQSNNCTGTVLCPCSGADQCEMGKCVTPPCVDDGTACKGVACGPVNSNNCTGTQVSCGACTNGASCTNNTCPCEDDGTACGSGVCGVVPSKNCTAQTVDCGACANGAPCTNNACGCVDDKTACANGACGVVPSINCMGQTVDCGGCPNGGACTNNVCPCKDDGTACGAGVCGTVPSKNCTGQTVDCGTCPNGGTCTNNTCGGCKDNGGACTGCNCGSVLNNCGQPVSCGCSNPQQTCNGNSCVDSCSCGDGVCNCGETSSSCLADCGSCGDGICDSNEDCSSCPADCGDCGGGGGGGGGGCGFDCCAKSDCGDGEDCSAQGECEATQ